jgi:hypothetical protein
MVPSAAATAAAVRVPGTGGAHRASVAASLRTVEYLGYRLAVPSSWPVYRVGKGSTICVRFNRHAVYLGTPSLTAHCPRNPIGRTEAILVEPVAGPSVVAAGVETAMAGALTADRAGHVAARVWPLRSAGEVTLDIRSAGLQVLATWQRDPGLIRRIISAAAVVAPLRHLALAPFVAASARLASTGRPILNRPATPTPAVYTGLGFDLCGMPSTTTLSKWSTSPYRAMNLYIGGANAACPQKPTTAWVSSVTQMGWGIIPTYVGLQAPTNNCGCASISPSSAYKEGLAAASDALSEMQAAGIGPENPIYYDMEGYPHTAVNTKAVLTFLKAWSARLHAHHYLSGVYSDALSGMPDLASRYTVSTYVEPNDIWFAVWNNAQNTQLSTIPSTDWANHQRIHQFNGGQNVTYGGVTLNIDGDYCDGNVVAASSL